MTDAAASAFKYTVSVLTYRAVRPLHVIACLGKLRHASRAGLTPSPTCLPGQGGSRKGMRPRSATNRVARAVSPPRKPMEGFSMSKHERDRPTITTGAPKVEGATMRPPGSRPYGSCSPRWGSSRCRRTIRSSSAASFEARGGRSRCVRDPPNIYKVVNPECFERCVKETIDWFRQHL